MQGDASHVHNHACANFGPHDMSSRIKYLRVLHVCLNVGPQAVCWRGVAYAAGGRYVRGIERFVAKAVALQVRVRLHKVLALKHGLALI